MYLRPFVLYRTFDFEVESDRMHQVEICIEDDGAPSLMTCRTMTIQLEDDNDNFPIFIPSDSYQIQVYENTPLGTTLLQVATMDADSAVNSAVEYSIVTDPNNPFGDGQSFFINPNTGHIRNLVNLDRETKDYYNFTILARNIALTTAATIQIQILDRNDNRPIIDPNSLLASLRENATRNTFVGQIVEMDSDLGVNKNVTFSFTGGDDADLGAFSINSEGEVYVDDYTQLDYETKTVYMLNVSCCSLRPLNYLGSFLFIANTSHF